MKVLKTKIVKSKTPIKVIDCFVSDGYLQGNSGSLPDVDIDYQSDRRQEVKEYIEKRYNHHGLQRVFSAGTMTTLKVKAVIKDVARTMRMSVYEFKGKLKDNEPFNREQLKNLIYLMGARNAFRVIRFHSNRQRRKVYQEVFGKYKNKERLNE